MSPPSQAVPSGGALMLDAEALYRELKSCVQQLQTPQTRLVGITSGGDRKSVV